jgi:hypothetical protein
MDASFSCLLKAVSGFAGQWGSLIVVNREV